LCLIVWINEFWGPINEQAAVSLILISTAKNRGPQIRRKLKIFTTICPKLMSRRH
jgi:hypothetical protein